MEDSDMKAIREIANGMEYIANEAVDKASYDVTRNARITKVYYSSYNVIDGYDINVDGKDYHIKKERGKGVIAKENDIVKLHIPCNNMSNIYLSYAHDPEDYVKEYSVDTANSPGILNYIRYDTKWGSDIEKIDFALGEYRTFPTTTKQFSSLSVTIPWSLSTNPNYFGSTFSVCADQGVIATLSENFGSEIIVKCYNENPTTTSPVTKFFNIFISETRCPTI